MNFHDKRSMSFNEFCVYYATYRRTQAAQREGQALYNALRNVRPELEHLIWNGPLDTFNNGTKVPELWTWILENW